MSDAQRSDEFLRALGAVQSIRDVADTMKARYPQRAAKIEENAVAAMAAVWRMLEE